MIVRSVLLLALAAALLGACASPTRVARPVGVPDAIELAELGGTEQEREFRATLYPTPRRVEYGVHLLPLADAAFVDQENPQFPILIREAGLGPGWEELPYEGYVLWVTAREGQVTVLAAARSDAGKPWLEQALDQLSVDWAGRRWIREARVLDHPGFALRGNKRPEEWEVAYRANFAWGARDKPGFAGRIVVPFAAPGSPLDPGPDGVRRVMETFTPWIERGATRFAVKFDDVAFALTPRAQLAYGSYPAALREFLSAVRERLVAECPGATLYYLPQTYWWDDPRLPSFADAIVGAGGLDRRLGLVMTGPEIVSETIDADGLVAARALLGLERTRALVYDNLGREGDWGPLTGRDAQLRFVADGVFGERGTPVNRLTRLDWSWNPEAYDPGRSYVRAVYELAGPAAFESLRAVCDAFRSGAATEKVEQRVDAFAALTPQSVSGPVSHARLVELLRGDIKRRRTHERATESTRDAAER